MKLGLLLFLALNGNSNSVNGIQLNQKLNAHSHSNSNVDAIQKMEQKIEVNINKEAEEMDAMLAFSKAMVDGVHVMDLPDAPDPNKPPEMDEE